MNFTDKVKAKLGNYQAVIRNRFYIFLNRYYPTYFDIQNRKKRIHAFGYSYPSELFLDQIPVKEKVWAEVIPGLKETYRFDSEVAYYEMYQSARFAFTWKKGGWDCLRHYEIIANGCVPVFRDIDSCPEDTLANLPKALLRQVNQDLIPWKDSTEYEELYRKISAEILEFGKNHSSSEAMGKKFLQLVDLPLGSKILMLTCDPNPNYSREFTFIGLNRVLKESGGICISYPELKPIYQDYPEKEALKLYGKGFGYTRRLERSHPDEIKVWTDDEVRASIQAKNWDFILFGKIGVDEPTLGSLPELPFWKEIHQNYSQNQIGFLYGGDHDQNLKDTGSLHTRHLLRHANYGVCFVRELSF